MRQIRAQPVTTFQSDPLFTSPHPLLTTRMLTSKRSIKIFYSLFMQIFNHLHKFYYQSSTTTFSRKFKSCCFLKTTGRMAYLATDTLISSIRNWATGYMLLIFFFMTQTVGSIKQKGDQTQFWLQCLILFSFLVITISKSKIKQS